MPSIDTNILVRWIVRDSPRHIALADKLIASSGNLYVSIAVIIEAEHVLDKVYRMPQKMIAEHLLALVDDSAFELDKKILSKTLSAYARHPALSFVDCLLSKEVAAQRKEPLYTFDKKLANQLEPAQLLK
jgi:predicted nucleic-acid-binding protein